jgi:hypothetical protein
MFYNNTQRGIRMKAVKRVKKREIPVRINA